jgi:hypothetical protein
MAIAAAVASGGTYAGVMLTSPPTVQATCTETMPAGGCHYLSDLQAAGLAIPADAIDAAGIFCIDLKEEDALAVAKAFLLTHPSFTLGQAEQYIAITQADMCLATTPKAAQSRLAVTQGQIGRVGEEDMMRVRTSIAAAGVAALALTGAGVGVIATATAASAQESEICTELFAVDSNIINVESALYEQRLTDLQKIASGKFSVIQDDTLRYQYTLDGLAILWDEHLQVQVQDKLADYGCSLPVGGGGGSGPS